MGKDFKKFGEILNVPDPDKDGKELKKTKPEESLWFFVAPIGLVVLALSLVGFILYTLTIPGIKAGASLLGILMGD